MNETPCIARSLNDFREGQTIAWVTDTYTSSDDHHEGIGRAVFKSRGCWSIEYFKGEEFDGFDSIDLDSGQWFILADAPPPAPYLVPAEAMKRLRELVSRAEDEDATELVSWSDWLRSARAVVDAAERQEP